MPVYIEGTQLKRSPKTMKADTSFYELYKGSVWISKQYSEQEIQGTNIAILSPSKNEFKVIAFVIRNGSQWGFTHKKYGTLEEVVTTVFETFGWSEAACRGFLQE